MDTQSPAWSVVLQGIIKSTNERQRLASALGVTHMTLLRWANGESRPQRAHLIHLIQAVHPSHRSELLDALEQQYPEIQTWLIEDSSDQIPSDFFSQVLNVRTMTTESLLFWRISDMVLKQALEQLDPNHLGMAIKLIQCMPPISPQNKIRSLRERAGKGTPPWTADLEHDVLFLGLVDDDLRVSQTFPVLKEQYEISAAAHPVRLEGRIAGCLLASSTQPSYFSQQRLNLLITYSDLIALAFNKDEFYPPSCLELRVMPPPEIQRPKIATFRQRVTAKFQQAMYQRHPLSNPEIELQAWQEIEAELLATEYDA